MVDDDELVQIPECEQMRDIDDDYVGLFGSLWMSSKCNKFLMMMRMIGV